jgi:hypothetical protein
MGRKILLNAAVPADGMAIVFLESSLEQLKEELGTGEGWLTYIGHPATAALLGLHTSNREMYEPQDGDWGYIVRLRQRQLKPGDLAEIRPEDLEVFRFMVYEAASLRRYIDDRFLVRVD